MNTMKALQWDGHKLQLNRVPAPSPAGGEALIRVTKAGICNTDLEIIRGYYPFQGTLGHEFVGVVEHAPDAALLGKRVVSDINASCHQCPECLEGQPHHCRNRTALGIKGRDGAFAEYLSIPVENLVPVPDSVADDLAVFAEPLAAALEIQEQISFFPGQEVAVVGDGKLGLLIALSLTQAGLAVTLVGHHPERAQGLELKGVTLLTKLPSRQFRVVIEATGSPSGFINAIQLTAPRGTLVLKSTYKEALVFNPARLVVDEITLIGSRCGPIAKAVTLMASGAVDPRGMISKICALEYGVEAIRLAKTKGVLKILLSMAD